MRWCLEQAEYLAKNKKTESSTKRETLTPPEVRDRIANAHCSDSEIKVTSYLGTRPPLGTWHIPVYEIAKETNLYKSEVSAVLKELESKDIINIESGDIYSWKLYSS